MQQFLTPSRQPALRPLRTVLLWTMWALAGAVVQAAPCQKSVRWYDDVPYSYRTADGQLAGLNVDLVREALSRMGCEARFVELPWARALAELEAGRLDILPGALKTVDRERFAYFSRPVTRSPNVLFVSKAAARKYRIQRLADVIDTDFRLGVQLGVVYGLEYKALLDNPQFKARLNPVTLRRNAWAMIDMGRLDGLIADETTGLVELEQLGLTQAMVKTKVVTSGEPALIAIGKASNNAEFVEAFDKALARMLAEGRFKAIREKHVPCPASADQLGCR